MGPPHFSQVSTSECCAMALVPFAQATTPSPPQLKPQSVQYLMINCTAALVGRVSTSLTFAADEAAESNVSVP
jgi:hypothetical protein